MRDHTGNYAYDNTPEVHRSGISEGRERLDKSIEVLTQIINQLGERLESGGVLRAGIKAVNQIVDKPTGSPGDSQLAGMMNGASVRLAELHTRTSDLLSRLDV